MAQSDIKRDRNDPCRDGVNLLLQTVGMDSLPFDPISKVAFEEIVSSFEGTGKFDLILEKVVATPCEVTTDKNAIFDGINAQQNTPFEQLAPEFAELNPSNDDRNIGFGDKPNLGTLETKKDERENMIRPSVEDLILRQMEVQTKMLMQLQGRMDHLAQSVNRLVETNDVRLTNSEGVNRKRYPVIFQLPRQGRVPKIRRQEHVPQQLPREGEQVRQNQPEAGDAVQPRQMFIFALYGQIYRKFQRLPTLILRSKMSKIARLFVALYPSHVRNVDVGLMIKVLFMTAIFMSRMRRRKSESGGLFIYNWSFTAKFLAVSTLVVIGFLMQNGFFKFIHSFFIKNNYPRRILDGEDLDIDFVLAEEERIRVAPPAGQNNANRDANNNNPVVNNNEGAQHRRPHENAADAAAPLVDGQANIGAAPAAEIFNWRNTILGGGIAPVVEDVQQQRLEQGVHVRILSFLLRILLDIVIFVGCFFLSIFPTWRPVAGQHQNQRVPIPEQVQPLMDQQPAQEENADQPIPQVRPPADAAEYDEAD